MGVLRTIAVIFIIFFILRLIGRYVLPIVMRSFAGKMQRNFEESMNEFKEQQSPTKPEGEVTISEKKNKEKDQNEGDYVDFEEVEWKYYIKATQSDIFNSYSW